MNPSPYERCCCIGWANPCEVCEDKLTFSEKGKKVRLSLRRGDEGKAIVIDGCVITDKGLKCDGLFLFKSACGKKFSCLVELKGARDIPHAFAQLACVMHERSEYQEIIQSFKGDERGVVVERTVIITNGSLSKTQRERLERKYDIRVAEIIHGEATSKIPDLRERLFSN